MRLKSALTLLALATAMPLLVCAIAAAAYVYRQENSSLMNATAARNRATLDAVDAEIRGTIGVLRSLGGSAALARDDIERFHEEARVTLANQSQWFNIILLSPAGQQLASARLPWGTRLRDTPVDPPSLQRTLSTLQPAVGDLAAGPPPGDTPGFAVRVPIIREGRPVYVLTAVLRSGAVRQILMNQNLPADWMSGIVGTDGRLIARVPTGQPGTLASADYLRATREASDGWYRGRTMEGHDTYTSFAKSSLTGWSIGFAIPAALIRSRALGPAILLGSGVVLSSVSALLIGLWLARRISRPIAGLAGAALMLGGPDKPPRVRSSIAEVAQLSDAVARAADAIEERERQLAVSREELERQAQELRSRDANRSRFLALLSHELRNPLAPLRTGLALLQMNIDPARRAATHALMDRQVAVMARLIDDLLDVGRIDRGQLKLQRTPVNLVAIVRHAADTIAPAITARRHDLRVRLPAREIWVQGDAVRLEQVIINLLTNAAKYTRAEGIIELRLGSNGSTTTVSVSDNGRGFDPAEADRVFELFTRLSDADGDAGGLGIGLSIARAIVQLHDGRISAHSDGPGLGAVFTVTLPVCEAPLTAGTAERPAAARTTARKVLIADDNIDVTDTLGALLRMLGYEVIVAHDGQEAVELADSVRPAVAFLDLSMPRLGGLAAARRIRSQDDGIVLVALTGLGQASDHQATREAGFDAHLVKPAPVEDVTRLVSMTRETVQGWTPSRQ